MTYTSAPHMPVPAGLLSPTGNAPQRLIDLMSDGFYLLLMIQRRQVPEHHQAFSAAIKQFFTRIENAAATAGIASEDIYAAKYAFCATIDELILSASDCPFRDQWELNPMQLVMFGDQLAGDKFFTYLEDLRSKGGVRLQALEVYHVCLLLGFQGKYRLEGSEQLGYLTARLGEELVFLKGKRTAFAPHWASPDRVAHLLRRQVPLWTPALVLGIVGAISFTAFSLTLSTDTQAQMALLDNVIQLPTRTASLTITLP
ncbi:type VI secretion system protein ImpK [Pseudomonas libanensis]|uniref:Type VI secretion system protein ImpK n=1 Tax=Pseudomonas libanensis TaxID=75588 RepID=A0A0R2YCA7_9PSED|nr:type IVB secretion system protein IcmH/DotU [Pseudomonas libanensis]KRP45757.1 type VI secretion system protein ImpK [Pseudomonas libanensis]SDK82959.1 type VI secretion system protein ImpK [Pseudomonas libanensis]